MFIVFWVSKCTPDPLLDITGPLRTGSKSGNNVNCRKCRGSGIQVTHRPIGPGMVQQMRGPCTDCEGTGGH